MSSVQLRPSESGFIIRFGIYEVDLRRGELRKSGLRIRLQEQPFQVLAILLKRHGEVVTREELCQEVWQADTFVDFDHALNTAVKKIRAALSDDADNPRFIETIPRRGYKFIAPVETTNQSSSPVSLVPRAHPAVRWLDPSNAFAVIGVIAVVIALVGVAWKLVPRRQLEQVSAPDFQRLTFDAGELSGARFTPDAASVIYSSGPRYFSEQVFNQRIGAAVAQPLGVSKALVLAVSRSGELALSVLDTGSDLGVWPERTFGTLARVPIGGGAPRELLQNAGAADWSPDGQLAIVREVDGKSRLEFPIGKILYENSGWISSPRFSPRGDRIAFLDHPIAPDDRGSVVMVDLNGNKTVLSGFWESERGLAWAPNGEEVWFTAARSGVSRALYAVNMRREERRVLSVAGGLSLQDIADDGRVLLTRDNERLGIEFVGPGMSEPRDLSWLDWSMSADLSRDGKMLLFGEEGENSGFTYQVGLRPTDGSSPVMLGEGTAESLSPDGKWALSIIPPPDAHVILLPLAAGTPRPLEKGAIQQYRFSRAEWLPDSQRIAFLAGEAGHGTRCYVQNVNGGAPRAFTPDGIVSCSASPDGKILAVKSDGEGLLYKSAVEGAPEQEIKLNPGEAPIGWTSDGGSIYLFDPRRNPPTITRLELASGRRSPWKQLRLPASNTQMKGDEVVITPDGQSYAYTYSRHLSDLYVVKGLK
ncbi:MAG TPA: winged helix-turn-helix domain-containing protein [Terriglobales bacterium]|nr:winged helix-turn-helix domain-containing protein [Terriglobales bacterium]